MKPYHPHPYSRSVGNLSSPYPTGHHNDQFSLAYNSGLLGPYYVPATPVYVGNVLAPTHSLTPSTQISSIGYTIPLPVQPALLAVQQAACIAPLNRPRDPFLDQVISESQIHSVDLHLHPLLLPTTHDLSLDFLSKRFNPVLLYTSRGDRDLGCIPFIKKSSPHKDVLDEYATDPRVARMVIRCPNFKRFLEKWSITIEQTSPITIRDVLQAVYDSLRGPVTVQERQRLSDKRFRQMSEAYFTRFDETKVLGPLRVDVLEGDHWFGGLMKVGRDSFEMIVKNSP